MANLCFILNTPAHFYFYRDLIGQLITEKNNVKILIRDYGETQELVQGHFEYEIYSKPEGAGLKKARNIPIDIMRGVSQQIDFKPSIVIGGGLAGAIIARTVGAKPILFWDNERSSSPFISLEINLANILRPTQITPKCYLDNIGAKQIRIDGYKEMAYLNPDKFNPDHSIFDRLKIGTKEKYAILRFSSFDALHDTKVNGMNDAVKREIVAQIEKKVIPFISSEKKLPSDLEKYHLPINKNEIHQALYHSILCLTEGGTMATEAALLGTPAIFVHPLAFRFGNFQELSEKYDLLYTYTNPSESLQKALKLLDNQDLKSQWRVKAERMFKEKSDVSKQLYWIVNNTKRTSTDQMPRFQFKNSWYNDNTLAKQS